MEETTTQAVNDYSYKEDASAYGDDNINRMREIYDNALITLLKATVPVSVIILKSTLLSIPPASAKTIVDLAGDRETVKIIIYDVNRKDIVCNATVCDMNENILNDEDVIIPLREIPHYLDKSCGVEPHD